MDELQAVYDRLKDRFELTLTTTAALDHGFTADFPILVGKAHGHIIELYFDGALFVLDVMDEAQTKGTHWHPYDVDCAVADVDEFMGGKIKYPLQHFPKM